MVAREEVAELPLHQVL